MSQQYCFKAEMIPSFMLRQLYEKGSLKNILDEKGDKVGFSFTLYNRLGSGTVEGFNISVDGEELPLDRIKIEKGGTVLKVEELAKSPMSFPVGERIKISIA
ncbi:MAG: hypothetical protein ACUVQ0_03225, partial [Thermoproteota archaeon]